MARAAEMRSPGRQMNLQGDSRSTMDGAFWENDFWGFAWNISEWKRIENSTDALISFARVTNIALSIVTVKILSCFDMVWIILSHVMRRYD